MNVEINQDGCKLRTLCEMVVEGLRAALKEVRTVNEMKTIKEVKKRKAMAHIMSHDVYHLGLSKISVVLDS